MQTNPPAIVVRAEAPLPEVAAQINAEHRHCGKALRDGLRYARNAGRLLLEAKARVPHGQWLPWVRENCDFSLRTAQAYLRVARHFAGLDEEEAQRVAHLPFREALRELADGVGPPGRPNNGGQDCGPEESAAALDLLDAPAVSGLDHLVGTDRRCTFLATARETGWATDGRFLSRLTPEEQEGFRQLPEGELGRPIENPERYFPAAEDLVPFEHASGFRVPKTFFLSGRHSGRVEVLRGPEGRLMLVDSRQFLLLRRRHQGATLWVSRGDLEAGPSYRRVVFRVQGENVAILQGLYGGEEWQSVPAVRRHLSEQVAEVRRLAGLVQKRFAVEVAEGGGLGRLGAFGRAAAMLRGMIRELEELLPAKPAKNAA